MTVEQNKAVATRFFEELLDNENVGILSDLFTEDCLFHRGDLTEPARGTAGVRSIVEKRIQLYRDFGRQFIKSLAKETWLPPERPIKEFTAVSSPHRSARLM